MPLALILMSQLRCFETSALKGSHKKRVEESKMLIRDLRTDNNRMKTDIDCHHSTMSADNPDDVGATKQHVAKTIFLDGLLPDIRKGVKMGCSL